MADGNDMEWKTLHRQNFGLHSLRSAPKIFTALADSGVDCPKQGNKVHHPLPTRFSADWSPCIPGVRAFVVLLGVLKSIDLAQKVSKTAANVSVLGSSRACGEDISAENVWAPRGSSVGPLHPLRGPSVVISGYVEQCDNDPGTRCIIPCVVECLKQFQIVMNVRQLKCCLIGEEPLITPTGAWKRLTVGNYSRSTYSTVALRGCGNNQRICMAH